MSQVSQAHRDPRDLPEKGVLQDLLAKTEKLVKTANLALRVLPELRAQEVYQDYQDFRDPKAIAAILGLTGKKENSERRVKRDHPDLKAKLDRSDLLAQLEFVESVGEKVRQVLQEFVARTAKWAHLVHQAQQADQDHLVFLELQE